MIYLNQTDIELIHIQIIDASGGSQGIRDKNRIASAIASMQQEVFGADLYPTIFEKAAVLMRGIIADHPFVDGNKRTGIMSALVFLNINKVNTKSIKNVEFEDFAVMVATDKLSVADIAAWLRQNSAKS